MKSLRSLLVLATLFASPLALSAREVVKPETYVPVKDALLNLVEFQVNKLHRTCTLTDKQKETMTAILVAEAEEMGALQKEYRGDLTFTIPGTIEIVSRTNASILRMVTPEQQKAALALIEERKAAFNNKLKITIEEMWRHQERLNNIPIQFDPAAAP
jgi:hypothetical protein